MSNDIFLGRQPILDRDRKTFGFELLYRDGPNPTSFFTDPDDASRVVMERALLHWGMERIIGDRFGMINAGPSLIRSGVHRALPPEGIIFEIREDEEFDGPTMDAFQRASLDGYHFALDNVTELAELERSRLLSFASIVKIEAGRVDRAELTQMVDHVRMHAPRALLTAEKVESLETFVECRDRGFDLFQGYFFTEPEVLRRSDRPTSSTAAITLMSEMQRGDVGIDRVEELVATDAALAYRLLSVVNSSAFGLNRRVDSLRHAIVLLGITQVRHLAVLLTLATAEHANEELIALGAARARMAGALEADPELRNGAFTVGLLSVTDAIFQTPMSELVADLPVSADVASALTDGTGPLGTILELIRACELGDVTTLESLRPDGVAALNEAYGESLQWANEIRTQMPERARRSRLTLNAGSDRSPAHG